MDLEKEFQTNDENALLHGVPDALIAEGLELLRSTELGLTQE